MKPMSPKKHIFYNFFPIPAKDQLQVSTHHELEPSENLANFFVSEGPNNGVSLELKLGLFDPWLIKKWLTFSDVNGEKSRLLLPKGLVEKHILSLMDARLIENIKNNGVRVAVLDWDTNSEQQLLFKQWRNGSYVLIGKWITGFVRERNLKEGDEIGLYWDQSSSRFSFRLLKQASSN
ncbi:putative B3 domain-containing protein At3g28853 [Quercus robur]|uniref:putative B3 domain-containing protein At3g28853 n=1 Tax=Quercus robur TaxID=38942 RepID=UPI00216233DF|nr:putative B3 domain-containing protein At3g28853 [Quercus robur]